MGKICLCCEVGKFALCLVFQKNFQFDFGHRLKKNR